MNRVKWFCDRVKGNTALMAVALIETFGADYYFDNVWPLTSLKESPRLDELVQFAIHDLIEKENRHE